MSKNKDTNDLIDAILEGKDVKSILDMSENTLVNEQVVSKDAVVKILKAITVESSEEDIQEAISENGLEEVSEEMADIIADLQEDESLHDMLSDEDKIEELADLIANEYFGDEDSGEDEDLNESKVNAANIMKAIKKLKSGFTGDQLDSVLKKVTKDEDELYKLSNYFAEIEEEDGLVSSYLDGEVSDKEMKAAVQSFIKDVMNEEVDELTQEEINENAKNLKKDAESLAITIKKLTPDEFTAEDLHKAIKNASISVKNNKMLNFLGDIEEEERVLSEYAEGTMSKAEFIKIVTSYLSTTKEYKESALKEAEDPEIKKEAQRLVKELKKLDSEDISEGDIDKAIKRAKAENNAGDVTIFLMELEEEESEISSFINGEISEKDFLDSVLDVVKRNRVE